MMEDKLTRGGSLYNESDSDSSVNSGSARSSTDKLKQSAAVEPKANERQYGLVPGPRQSFNGQTPVSNSAPRQSIGKTSSTSPRPAPTSKSSSTSPRPAPAQSSNSATATSPTPSSNRQTFSGIRSVGESPSQHINSSFQSPPRAVISVKDLSPSSSSSSGSSSSRSPSPSSHLSHHSPHSSHSPISRTSGNSPNSLQSPRADEGVRGDGAGDTEKTKKELESASELDSPPGPSPRPLLTDSILDSSWEMDNNQQRRPTGISEGSFEFLVPKHTSSAAYMAPAAMLPGSAGNGYDEERGEQEEEWMGQIDEESIQSSHNPGPFISQTSSVSLASLLPDRTLRVGADGWGDGLKKVACGYDGEMLKGVGGRDKQEVSVLLDDTSFVSEGGGSVHIHVENAEPEENEKADEVIAKGEENIGDDIKPDKVNIDVHQKSEEDVGYFDLSPSEDGLDKEDKEDEKEEPIHTLASMPTAMSIISDFTQAFVSVSLDQGMHKRVVDVVDIRAEGMVMPASSRSSSPSMLPTPSPSPPSLSPTVTTMKVLAEGLAAGLVQDMVERGGEKAALRILETPTRAPAVAVDGENEEDSLLPAVDDLPKSTVDVSPDYLTALSEEDDVQRLPTPTEEVHQYPVSSEHSMEQKAEERQDALVAEEKVSSPRDQNKVTIASEDEHRAVANNSVTLQTTDEKPNKAESKDMDVSLPAAADRAVADNAVTLQPTDEEPSKAESKDMKEMNVSLNVVTLQPTDEKPSKAESKEIDVSLPVAAESKVVKDHKEVETKDRGQKEEQPSIISSSTPVSEVKAGENKSSDILQGSKSVLPSRNEAQEEKRDAHFPVISTEKNDSVSEESKNIHLPGLSQPIGEIDGQGEENRDAPTLVMESPRDDKSHLGPDYQLDPSAEHLEKVDPTSLASAKDTYPLPEAMNDEPVVVGIEREMAPVLSNDMNAMDRQESEDEGRLEGLEIVGVGVGVDTDMSDNLGKSGDIDLGNDEEDEAMAKLMGQENEEEQDLEEEQLDGILGIETSLSEGDGLGIPFLDAPASSHSLSNESNEDLHFKLKLEQFDRVRSRSSLISTSQGALTPHTPPTNISATTLATPLSLRFPPTPLASALATPQTVDKAESLVIGEIRGEEVAKKLAFAENDAEEKEILPPLRVVQTGDISSVSTLSQMTPSASLRLPHNSQLPPLATTWQILDCFTSKQQQSLLQLVHVLSKENAQELYLQKYAEMCESYADAESALETCVELVKYVLCTKIYLVPVEDMALDLAELLARPEVDLNKQWKEEEKKELLNMLYAVEKELKKQAHDIHAYNNLLTSGIERQLRLLNSLKLEEKYQNLIPNSLVTLSEVASTDLLEFVRNPSLTLTKWYHAFYSHLPHRVEEEMQGSLKRKSELNIRLVQANEKIDRQYEKFVDAKIAVLESEDLMQVAQEVLHEHIQGQLHKTNDIFKALCYPPYEEEQNDAHLEVYRDMFFKNEDDDNDQIVLPTSSSRPALLGKNAWEDDTNNMSEITGERDANRSDDPPVLEESLHSPQKKRHQRNNKFSIRTEYHSSPYFPEPYALPLRDDNTIWLHVDESDRPKSAPGFTNRYNQTSAAFRQLVQNADPLFRSAEMHNKLCMGVDTDKAFASSIIGPKEQRKVNKLYKMSALEVKTALKKSIIRSSLFSTDIKSILQSEASKQDPILHNLMTFQAKPTKFALTKDLINIYSFSPSKAMDFAKKAAKTKEELIKFKNRHKKAKIPQKKLSMAQRLLNETTDTSFNEEEVIMGKHHKGRHKPSPSRHAHLHAHHLHDAPPPPDPSSPFDKPKEAIADYLDLGNVKSSTPFVARMRSEAEVARRGTRRGKMGSVTMRPFREEEKVVWQGEVEEGGWGEMVQGMQLGDRRAKYELGPEVGGDDELESDEDDEIDGNDGNDDENLLLPPPLWALPIDERDAILKDEFEREIKHLIPADLFPPLSTETPSTPVEELISSFLEKLTTPSPLIPVPLTAPRHPTNASVVHVSNPTQSLNILFATLLKMGQEKVSDPRFSLSEKISHKEGVLRAIFMIIERSLQRSRGKDRGELVDLQAPPDNTFSHTPISPTPLAFTPSSVNITFNAYPRPHDPPLHIPHGGLVRMNVVDYTGGIGVGGRVRSIAVDESAKFDNGGYENRIKRLEKELTTPPILSTLPFRTGVGKRGSSAVPSLPMPTSSTLDTKVDHLLFSLRSELRKIRSGKEKSGELLTVHLTLPLLFLTAQEVRYRSGKMLLRMRRARGQVPPPPPILDSLREIWRVGTQEEVEGNENHEFPPSSSPFSYLLPLLTPDPLPSSLPRNEHVETATCQAAVQEFRNAAQEANVRAQENLSYARHLAKLTNK